MKLGLNSYRLLTKLAAPAAAGYLLMRSRRQPAYRNYWGERFGWAQYPVPGACPRIWVHAVSVGETNAAAPLIAGILRRWPKTDVLLTHMTPTGRDAGRKIVAMAPERVFQCYLPYDTPGAVSEFFRQTKPSVGLIMETEIWPNLMAESEKWGVPVILVNARESEKSLKKAMKVKDLMSQTVRRFARILAQSEADADRFRQLGAEKIQVTGSLKFDISPDPALQATGKRWKAAISRKIELMASTRDGEEALFRTAFLERRSRFPGDSFLTVLVPRHPQRFDSVYNLLSQNGIRVQRRSAMTEPEDLRQDTEVLLGDSMGEMDFYCAMADVAVMGGSFLPYGCQNLIEPCAQGVPVILGPSVFNFAAVAQEAVNAGAAVQVENMEAALAVSREWLGSGDAREGREAKAREFASAYTGATERTLNALEQIWNHRQA